MRDLHRRFLGAAATAIAVAAAVLVLVALALPAPARAAITYESEEVTVVRLINDYRESLGLERLKVSDLISDACDKHGLDMAKYSFFAHSSVQSSYFPVGADARVRMSLCGYGNPMGWGEILGAGQSKAASVFAQWKASPAHNPHMIEPSFRVMGVSQVCSPGSAFPYYWTVDFGVFVDETARYIDGDSGSPTEPPTTTTTAPPVTTTTTTAPPVTTTTTTSSSTTTSTVMPSAVEFADVRQGDPFYEAITTLAALGVVSGSDGLFHPNELVTRAQFAKIVVLALGRHTPAIDNAGAATFPDVPYRGISYPFDFVEEAVALGIIRGRDDGTFGPAANVTRAQLALMLVRAGGEALVDPPATVACPFTDVPAYARDAITVAYYNGLLSGKTPTLFGPYSSATRGQVAKMVFGLYQAVGD